MFSCYVEVFYLSKCDLQERIRAGKEWLAAKRMAEENDRKRCVSKLKLCYFIKCLVLGQKSLF